MENVDSIKVRVIAKFGNGLIIAKVDSLRYPNGIPVIPNIPCDAGRFIVWYFEMGQNLNMDH